MTDFPERIVAHFFVMIPDVQFRIGKSITPGPVILWSPDSR